MKRTILILAALAAFVSANAEPIKLSRLDATRLHNALEAVTPGLTPENTFILADNLTALAPIADAFRKADVARQRTEARIKAAPGEEAAKVEKLLALGEGFDAKAEELVTVELTRLEISRDETKAANITPALLTQLRRHLQPKPKP